MPNRFGSIGLTEKDFDEPDVVVACDCRRQRRPSQTD
jgi:hypothetical protein